MSLVGTPSDVGRTHRALAARRRRQRRDVEARAEEDRQQNFFQSEQVKRGIRSDRLTREAAARRPAAQRALDEKAGIMGPPASGAGPVVARTTPAERRRARQQRRADKDAELAQNLQDRERKRADAQRRKTERRNRIRSRLGLPPLAVPGGGGGGGRHALSTPIQVDDIETFDRRTVRTGEFIKTPDGQVSQYIINDAGVETFIPFTTSATGGLIPDASKIGFDAWAEALPFNERRDMGNLAVESQTQFGVGISRVHRERNAIIDAIDLDGTMTEAQARGPREDLDRREARILFEFERTGAAKRAQRHPVGQGEGDIWTTDRGVLLTRTQQGVKKLDKDESGEENLKLAKEAYKAAKAKMITEGQEPTDDEWDAEMRRLERLAVRTSAAVDRMSGGQEEGLEGGSAPGAGQDLGLPQQEQDRKQALQRLQAPERGAELTIAPAQGIAQHVAQFHPEADTSEKQRFLARRIARELGWDATQERREIRGKR